jgi:hypothetical protein
MGLSSGQKFGECERRPFLIKIILLEHVTINTENVTIAWLKLETKLLSCCILYALLPAATKLRRLAVL